jgi:hypothetical protein
VMSCLGCVNARVPAHLGPCVAVATPHLWRCRRRRDEMQERGEGEELLRPERRWKGTATRLRGWVTLVGPWRVWLLAARSPCTLARLEHHHACAGRAPWPPGACPAPARCHLHDQHQDLIAHAWQAPPPACSPATRCTAAPYGRGVWGRGCGARGRGVFKGLASSTSQSEEVAQPGHAGRLTWPCGRGEEGKGDGNVRKKKRGVHLRTQ